VSRASASTARSGMHGCFSEIESKSKPTSRSLIIVPFGTFSFANSAGSTVRYPAAQGVAGSCGAVTMKRSLRMNSAAKLTAASTSSRESCG